MSFRTIVIGAILTVGAGSPFAAADHPEVVKNVAYYEGRDADPVRHKLDLYLPTDVKEFPVLFFIHGGGWIYGTKEYYGVMGAVARSFTRNGIGVVAPNYRLSPKVRHPEHIRDVARAFAWTYYNIGKYGGCNKEIFVAGHSAGGHLAALLATDGRYLQDHKLSLAAIRGAMPISGVFVFSSDRVFDVPFGPDPAGRDDATPIKHINASCPPFLIMYADRDFPYCDRTGAVAFHKALRAQNLPAEIYEIPHRNHLSIFMSAIWDTDPLAQAMLTFIMGHSTIDRFKSDPAAAVARFSDFLGHYLEHDKMK